jgi:hypothetical protein
MEPTDEYDVETNTVMALAWLYDCGKRGENNFEVPWDWRIAYEQDERLRKESNPSSTHGDGDGGNVGKEATPRDG